MESENTTSMVSVGIPTYNRDSMLPRAIESVRNQTHQNIEIIICDNASEDRTQLLCREFSNIDSRVRYFRHHKNIGPTKNFSATLDHATGKFFMWLSDDDWLEADYISKCVNILSEEKGAVLAGGKVSYYKQGKYSHNGKPVSYNQKTPFGRIANYYRTVLDNGIFYSIIRTENLRKTSLENCLGGDWLLISGLLYQGYSCVDTSTTIHRELGGSSDNYKKLVSTLSLSKAKALLPMSVFVATSAAKDILYLGQIYRKTSLLKRAIFSIFIFCLILILKPIQEIMRLLRKQST